MSRYYLLDRGFPYLAVLTSAEAAELFDSVPPERRHGTLAEGFQSWELLLNGMSQRIAFRTHVDPIPPDQLVAVCRQLGPIGTLPEGLASCT
jgi:hypothetical protein